MELTLTEIAEHLGISKDAARARLKRLGVQPVRHIGGGPMGLYAEDSIERIREVLGRGRPKKDKRAE